MRTVYDKKQNCTGCEACINICPKNAIHMKTNLKGFAYPKVDRRTCVDCGRCQKVCQIFATASSKNQSLYFYGVKAKDEFRLGSSSGGVFPALAKSVLENQGAVCSAGFDENMVVKHQLIYKAEDISKLTKTKYVQSEIGDCYRQIKKWMEDNTRDGFSDQQMLFVGTPCQCEGLKLFLGKDYPNLLIVSLICYGVPSPGVWRKYVKKLEKASGAKLTAFDFRDKRNHDSGHTLSYTAADGRETAYSMYVDPYCKQYFHNEIIRENCFNCKFCTPDRHFDLTIGDFWGVDKAAPELDDKMGVSVVVVHSEQGQRVLDESKKFIADFVEVSREQVLQPRLVGPTVK